MKKLLTELGACDEAVKWVGDRTLKQAWDDCERGDWMLWLCAKMEGEAGWPDKNQVVRTICACAQTIMHFWTARYPNDRRPQIALQVALDWIEGTVMLDQVEGAAHAAAEAAFGADDPDAHFAAAVAADVAYAIVYPGAFADGAYSATVGLETADIVRRMIPPDWSNVNEL